MRRCGCRRPWSGKSDRHASLCWQGFQGSAHYLHRLSELMMRVIAMVIISSRKSIERVRSSSLMRGEHEEK
ncbi:MAG: hypothetical protein ABIQ57_13315 [Candidatus Kapaibacterium sp.]